jgi:hypothetical protein
MDQTIDTIKTDLISLGTYLLLSRDLSTFNDGNEQVHRKRYCSCFRIFILSPDAMEHAGFRLRSRSTFEEELRKPYTGEFLSNARHLEQEHFVVDVYERDQGGFCCLLHRRLRGEQIHASDDPYGVVRTYVARSHDLTEGIAPYWFALEVPAGMTYRARWS